MRLPPSGGEPFHGREAELRLIAELARSAQGSGVVVLSGPARIGKTALAEQYARVHAAEHGVIWSISAVNEAELDFGMAELAERLEPKLSATTAESRVAWARSWLQSHTGWLLIVDDAPSKSVVAATLDLATRGLVIVTSANLSGWGEAARRVTVGPMSEEDAVSLMAGLLGGGSARELQDIAELCSQLGLMPEPIQKVSKQMAATGVGAGRCLSSLKSVPPFLRTQAETVRLLEVMLAAGSNGSSSDRIVAMLSTEMGRSFLGSGFLAERWTDVLLKGLGVNEQQLLALREAHAEDRKRR